MSAASKRWYALTPDSGQINLFETADEAREFARERLDRWLAAFRSDRFDNWRFEWGELETREAAVCTSQVLLEDGGIGQETWELQAVPTSPGGTVVVREGEDEP